MFWNDPILYGASFPYRDINSPLQTPGMNLPYRDINSSLQTPWMNLPYRDANSPLQTPFVGGFTPWQNVPRFVPPAYGYTQPPFLGLPQVNIPPHFHGTVFDPFVQPTLGLPQANWCRPLTY